VREHFAFEPSELPELLARLSERHAGAAVLSTCNRTEIYLTDPRGVGDPRGTIALLSEIKGEHPVEGAPFFTLGGKEATRHLFRVAAGVESMVIGESEILGQVRGAFAAATTAGTHNAVLSRLFHTAIRVGRRVRSQTHIGRHAVSVSSMAVALAKRTLGDLSSRTVLVVSAGEAGKLAARSLAESGTKKLLVTTRRPERGRELAADLGGRALPFDRLASAISEADIVISSSAAPGYLIGRSELNGAAKRSGRPLLLIDIAVPRDIDPAARTLPNVHLFDIDDLQALVEENLGARRREVAKADRIVDEGVAEFAEWLRHQGVVPTVAALRARAESLSEAELERTFKRLNGLTPQQRQRVEAMTRSVVKRLLHDPIARLKGNDGERYVAAARELFALDDSHDPAEE
jgi:glutamyl-tRNA reductase